MATRRLRVEFIRFALLLTMTVALISVATRHGDHGSGRNQAARGHHPAATGSPSTGGTTSAPSSASATPSSPGTSPSSQPGAGGPTGSSGAGTGTSGKGAGGSGQVSGVPTLPRTGSTETAELAALAALCIAAGSIGMRVSRPRPKPAGHAEGPLPADAAQSGQTPGSSVSNRPGTS